MRILVFLLLFPLSVLAQRPSPEVRRLVRKMDTKYFYYTDSYKPTQKIRSRFWLLCSAATTDELLLLTGHRKAVIRGYAALALVQRKYAAIGEVAERLIAGNDWVRVRGECTTQLMPTCHVLYKWAAVHGEYEGVFRHLDNTIACKDSL